jgi:glycosyltransferase involved in cell wall biosynthesis
MAQLKDIPPNVKYMGNVKPQDVYRLSSLILIPSLWPEPFGRVASEALLSGVPVLASRTGGLPEAVGTNLALVDDFKNPQSWYSALINILENDEVLDEIVKKGQENSQKFLENNIKNTIVSAIGTC